MKSTFLELLEINIPSILAITAPVEDILKIVALCLSVCVSLIILIRKIYEWYKDAKKDGKITKEEFKNLKEIAEEGSKELADEIVEIVETIEESKGDKK